MFPDARGGWRDRSNVGAAFRRVRGGSQFEWVKTHTYRKTVATLLDQSGASARMIADQLGHSRVSMTQDVYLGRRASNAGNVAALEAWNAARDRGRGQRPVTRTLPIWRLLTSLLAWFHARSVGPVGLEPTTRGFNVCGLLIGVSPCLVAGIVSP